MIKQIKAGETNVLERNTGIGKGGQDINSSFDGMMLRDSVGIDSLGGGTTAGNPALTEASYILPTE